MVALAELMTRRSSPTDVPVKPPGYGAAVTPDAFAVAFRANPGGAAVFSDFDGTLSPIVLDPAAAQPLAGVVDVLHDLAAGVRRVGIVSGRPVSFLADRLELDDRPPTTMLLSGLYGIERLEGGVHSVDETALGFRATVEQVASLADAAAPPGVGVERKGLSVTLHIRTAVDEEEWARAWAATTAASTGLVVHEGRRSFELRPPVDLDKGTAVRSLVEGMEVACFLGDDIGDLPAFDALAAHAAATGAIVARIGVRSNEAPSELLDATDFVVDGPEGSLALLRRLLS